MKRILRHIKYGPHAHPKYWVPSFADGRYVGWDPVPLPTGDHLARRRVELDRRKQRARS